MKRAKKVDVDYIHSVSYLSNYMDEEAINEEQFMVYVKGNKTSFHCDCGCNVFHKDKDGNFICNSCDTIWRKEDK